MTLKLNSNEIECIDKLDEAIDILGGITERSREKTRFVCSKNK